MRRILLAAMLLGTAQAASAADLPDVPLRGSFFDPPAPTRVIWDGFYAGGQWGYGNSNMNFSNSTQDMVARLLVNTTVESEYNISKWPVLGTASSHGSGWGGFVGYNSQWDDIVIGAEANYVHGSFGGSDTNVMGRSFTTSDGYTHNLAYGAAASIAVRDMGTLRVRAGYAWNSFLPYAFAGLALGQGDVYRAATISDSAVNAAAPAGFQTINYTDSAVSNQPGQLLVGYSAGLGVDMMLVRGLFLRAEYEYLRFTSPVDVTVNTVRAGVGYKF